MYRPLAAFLLGCLASLPPAQATEESAYRAARAEIAKNTDGFFIDANPEALDRVWALTEQWVAEYLNRRPNAAAGAIAVAWSIYDPESEMTVETEGDLYLVAPRWGEIGAVFLFAKDKGRYRAVWSSRRILRRSINRFPELAAWSASHALGDCRQHVSQKDWAQCGGLAGEIGFLPEDAAGHTRFYIDAGYSQPAGATIAKQFSIWLYDGKTAVTQFEKTYAVLLSDSGLHVEGGDRLRLRAKEDFQTFFSCGACEGRPMEWTIGIDPRKPVTDLGRKSLAPELDTIDDLFNRVARGRPTADLAAPAVADAIQKVVAEQRANLGSDAAKDFNLGQLLASNVRREGGATTVCFAPDDAGPFLFTLTPNGGSYFVSAMREIAGGSPEAGACAGSESR